MPTLTEVLDGPGSFRFTLKTRDPELRRLCARYNQILLYEGERLIGAGVITQPPRTLEVSGPGLRWYLGDGDIGPRIVDRTYLSGLSRLSNGGFTLGDLYWTVGDPPAVWTIDTDAQCAASTQRAALVSEEQFSVLAGEQFTVSGTAARGAGATGRLLLKARITGRFAPTERLTDPGFTSSPPWVEFTGGGVMQIVTDPANAYQGTRVLRIGPHPRPNLLSNGGFEFGPTPPDSHPDIFQYGLGATPDRIAKFESAVAAITFPLSRLDLSSLLDGKITVRWLELGTSPEGGENAGFFRQFEDGSATIDIDEDVDSRSDEDRMAVAIHEIGHAVDAYWLTPNHRAAIAAAYHAGGEDSHGWKNASDAYLDQIGEAFANGFIWAFTSLRPPWTTVPTFNHDTTEAIASQLQQILGTDAAAYFADAWQHDYAETPENFERTAGVGRAGSYGISIEGAPFTIPVASDGRDSIKQDNIPVIGGQSYCAKLYVRAPAPADGGAVWWQVEFNAPNSDGSANDFCEDNAPTIRPGETTTFVESRHQGPTDDQWVLLQATVTAPDNATLAVFRIQADLDAAGGGFAVDDANLILHDTAWAIVTSEAFTVQPGRTYRYAASIRKDASAVGGQVRLLVVLNDPTGLNPERYVGSPVIDDTGELWVEERLDVEIPDGYTTTRLELQSRNVERGYWWIGRSSVQLTDTSLAEDTDLTLVWPATSGAGTVTRSRVVTIPDGAEQLHVEWVAEPGAGGWQVTDTSLIRTDQPPVAAAAVVAELLTHPTTSLPLLDTGTIHDADLLSDWRVRNLTCLEALTTLSSRGLVQPARELRIHPDGTVDWGLAEELYTDRTRLLLTAEDVQVLDIQVDDDARDGVTGIDVIGAERPIPGGRPRLITGHADVVLDGVDWQGNPLERSLLVQDSGIEHVGYADGWAAYLAERQTPREQVTLRLADWRVVGRFDVGDWIYLEAKALDLDDESYMQPRDGATIAPRRLRVLERTWTMGLEGSFRVVVRRGPGDLIDISDHIAWEGANAAEIVVGDRIPDFVTDPQAGPVTVQFLRFRSAGAR